MRPLLATLFLMIPCFLLPLAAPVTAQTQTGEIFGSVTDPSGAVLPGVTVTLTSPALIQPLSAITASSGGYRFPSLPIGTYTLSFEMSGFRKINREGVLVETGFHAEINTRLEISTIEESITVTGESPVIDTRSTTVTAHFTRDQLDVIPSARDPWVVLEQTPGMVMDRQNVGGNQSGQQSDFIVHGSAANEQWNLDGATITDMAASASPGYYDFDSFEEIQIVTGGGDASTEAAGVSINMVTKSGGNTLKGSSRFFVTDNNLQSDNVTPELQAQGAGAGNPIQNILDYGIEVGGPILRDKAWFWGAAARNDIEVGVVGFLKPGAIDPNDPDSLNTDQTILETYNLKLQYQWDKKHKSSFLWNPADKIRNARGASRLVRPEATVRQSSPGALYKWDHQWVANDRLVLEGKYTWNDSGFLLDFHEDELASVQRVIDIVTQVESRSGTRTDNIRPTYEARFDGNYYLPATWGGNHSTKFGIRYRSTPYQTITRTGGGATARPRNGAYRCPNPGVFGTGCPEASIYRDGHTTRDLWEWSVYFNDSYEKGRLTLNLGLRYDYQKDRAKAANIPANPILPDLLPAVDFDGAESEADFDDFSPRIGVTYDLFGSGKTILKANVARYTGTGIYTAGTLSPTGQTQLRYRWDDLNADTFVQRNELELNRLISFSSNWDPNNPSAVRTPATVDPDLTNDLTDEFIVGVDHEIAPNFAVSASYIWRRYYDFNDDYRLDSQLRSSDYVQRSLAAPCGNASCDQRTYTVTYWDLPFQIPAATILRNDGERRQYQGFEFVARKRFSNRWLMNGSVVLNDTRYYYDGGPDRDYKDPTNIAQQHGQQVGSLNARWVAKLSGMYALPYGVSVAGFFNARDGLPFDRVVLVTGRSGGIGNIEVYPYPRTTERYPNYVQVDMRIEKSFVFGKRRLVGMLDGFNLANSNVVLDRVNRQNASNANNVEEILAPRIFRFGVRFEF